MKDPFVIKDAVVVSREWFDRVQLRLSNEGCPFCGSRREPLCAKGDETFLPRRGCLDCDTWFGPPELRR